MLEPLRQDAGLADETEKIKEFLSRRKGIGRLTVQIALAVAAFILTVEIGIMFFLIQSRRDGIERLREKMYGKAITRPILQPSDLLTDEEIQKEIQIHKHKLFISISVLLVVVVTGTALIVHKRVVRPIHKILAYDDDSLHAKIAFIPKDQYPPNEIGALMHSRNLMLYSLLQAYKKEAIDSLVAAVDAKDRYTYGHSRRVGHYAALIGRMMGLSQEEQDNLRQAGDLHDIGKIAIPEEILNAPRVLTESEWEVMKKHPRRGEAMLRFTTFPEEVRMGALTHHENQDGSGYPDRLKGDQIPMVGRILHVADALDAMTSTRPYRKPMTMDMVVDEFMRNKGRMFDPKIVDTLLSLIERGKIKIPHVTLPPSAAAESA